MDITAEDEKAIKSNVKERQRRVTAEETIFSQNLPQTDHYFMNFAKCKTFENFGKIVTAKDKQIRIECESFVNEAVIDPKPRIVEMGISE